MTAQLTNPASLDPLAVLRRARVAIHRHGVMGAAAAALLRLLAPVLEYSRLVEVVCDLEGPCESVPLPEGLEIRVGGTDDLALLEPLVPPAVLASYRERCAQGMVPFLAIEEGKAVAFDWLALRSFYEPFIRMQVELRAHEAYGFDAYTLLELRSRGLHSLLHVALCGHARHLGKRRLRGYYGGDQLPRVQRNLQRLGMRFWATEELLAIRVLGSTWRWLRPYVSKGDAGG